MSTKINIIIFGIEKTGSQLINDIIAQQKQNSQSTELHIPIIANDSVAFFEKEGIKNAWEANFIQFAIPYNISDIVHYVKSVGLQNLIAVDTTSQYEVIADYPLLLQSGFDIVTSNQKYQSAPLKYNFQINNFFQYNNQQLFEINSDETKNTASEILQQINLIAANLTKHQLAV